MSLGETRPAAWRLVDIVTGAAVGVIFGVIFQGWNFLWAGLQPAFASLPPMEGLIYGVWLLPAVLGGLIIRKPGAALYAEALAAIVSALLGAQWGLLTIVYGFMQGAAAELIFAFGLYRAWGIFPAVLAGAAAGAAAALLDLYAFYQGWSAVWQTTYVAIVMVSAAIVAGLGGWVLVRSLAQTGVLAAFPSGRAQRPI
jgi:energy-coupling factor transport system substrate-specific component